MQKLGFSGMKSLDHLRSVHGSLAGAAKTSQISNSRLSSDSISHGSFANLKLTAERLVKEQASVKTDLEMAHTRLKRATEQIHVLEAKLQQAVNENAKLKVKQTEDTKLWKGLDSKFSSTKMLCDQLTETLQHLTCQTHAAEENKNFFEEKLAHSSKAFDDLNCLQNDLSVKLECAGNTINAGKQEILELRREKEEMEKYFRDERSATDNVIKEKDAAMKQLEEIVEEKKAHLETLESHMQEMQHEFSLKEDSSKCLRATLSNLEDERNALQLSNQNFAQKIDKSCQEFKELEMLLNHLVIQLVESNKDSATISDQVSRLFLSFGAYDELLQQEKCLAIKSAQGKYEQLHGQFMHTRSENDAFKMEIEELKNKIMELQKAQEFAMVQQAEECRLAEDKIRILETEAEVLVTNKKESDELASKLGEKVKDLSKACSLTETQMQDLLKKISELELEKQDLQDKVQSVIQERSKDTEALQNEIVKRDQHVDSLENQINHLRCVLDEKEQLHISSLEREKQLEEQKSEIQALQAATECKLAEARKQYDLMLEGKQLELSKHLKELSQRNDQAINDIRRKYEVEKIEIANAEKEKAEKLIKEMERKCDEKISENKEEAQQYLMRVKEEHGAMISRIKQDYDEKESNLRAHQKEELQEIQLQAENEMREKISLLRKEHEIQIKALKLQHKDDYRKLQEELELQKSKEEKQRALLQLQWKVMGENQQVDQEANSKKEYSVSSIKMRDSYGRKEHHLALTSPESRRKDVNLLGIMRTPIANILKKVEKGGPGNIPKHSKKVTRHEYEVETSNGRTITKRRKTKSTVMFGEPNSQKAVHSKTPNASKDIMKIRKFLTEDCLTS
ncbi:synaptonemal complex protein ZEP1-like isoform X2 [Phoenix dactylifera]|uniref:Synaptonemal complex protein ZEP1-like isoform X2 n=1 Tax=Phoenix dactylifera TaxID=42345 RepID=A0A8B9AC17_PHODC|nr:synaptonemal complex protein ZEP1-like isoform X2 [Phoenix dactylifera]XP_038983276.1 synaptonemal complex protein ZEP1-like isoform X2 [Phoenix dactylifera]XP_038983277.1 synaptonemal complex protein ZEP1-like isoform X2 [Phoenix dactylifera]